MEVSSQREAGVNEQERYGTLWRVPHRHRLTRARFQSPAHAIIRPCYGQNKNERDTLPSGTAWPTALRAVVCAESVGQGQRTQLCEHRAAYLATKAVL